MTMMTMMTTMTAVLTIPKYLLIYLLLQLDVEPPVRNYQKEDLGLVILTMNGKMKEHVKNIFSHFLWQMEGLGEFRAGKLI